MQFVPPILKFMRTRHLEGSSLQTGDMDDRISLRRLVGRHVYLEEKVDGANCGFRFDDSGVMFAQSRGHYLDLAKRNAPRERDWNLFKDWLSAHEDAFLKRFENRYLVYGEWCAIAHSVFYDRLPGFFMEFDICDLETGDFLGTPERHALCEGLPIASVPVLWHGVWEEGMDIKALVGPSLFKTPSKPLPLSPAPDGHGTWIDGLSRACAMVGDDYPKRLAKMDITDDSEGLYLKIEEDGRVVDRAKWVRPGFTQTIINADEHWQSRFPVPNLLASPSDMYLVHLARSSAQPSEAYDPMQPWLWAPWADCNPALQVMGRGHGRR